MKTVPLCLAEFSFENKIRSVIKRRKKLLAPIILLDQRQVGSFASIRIGHNVGTRLSISLMLMLLLLFTYTLFLESRIARNDAKAAVDNSALAELRKRRKGRNFVELEAYVRVCGGEVIEKGKIFVRWGWGWFLVEGKNPARRNWQRRKMLKSDS